MSDVDPKILDEFNVSSPQFIAETAIAKVWRVTRSDKSLAALKVYKGDDMRNEGPGVVFLQNCDGQGAAKIFQTGKNAFLMEYLDGITLGELTRQGDDQQAAQKLVETANKLQKVQFGRSYSFDRSYPWPKLEDWVVGLMELERGASWTDENWRHIEMSRHLAKELISTQKDVSLLHGDLHHDNIIKGARGYCAIDAKGVIGEKTYELANAVCNPIGAEELMVSRDRIEFLLTLWCEDFNLERARFLKWIIAQRGMSISWSGNEIASDHVSFQMLDILIDLQRAQK